MFFISFFYINWNLCLKVVDNIKEFVFFWREKKFIMCIDIEELRVKFFYMVD